MRKELFGVCRLVLAVLVVGAAAIATSQSVRAGGNRESEGGNLGPGCAPERPAIAHHAGGVAVEDRRGEERRAPVPCSTRTGFRTSEVSIAVTNQGTVLVQPAFPQGGAPIGVLRSVDRGGTWE